MVVHGTAAGWGCECSERDCKSINTSFYLVAVFHGDEEAIVYERAGPFYWKDRSSRKNLAPACSRLPLLAHCL